MTTRQEKAAQTRRDLLAAAQVVFERKGYLNATITDITTPRPARPRARSTTISTARKRCSSRSRATSATTRMHSSPRPRDDLRDLGPHLAVFWQLQSRHRTVMAALRDAALVDPAFAQRMHDFGIEQMKPWAELLTALAEGIAALTRFVERGLLG
ncbi:TetR/AcrR family transcriptional regulator [Rhodococcus opacus]|uniref:TetR/AcrR family transcriptional regulator n=1 Tax=Rhodococcus opacus TaxID=37919 RepID=UPI0026BD1964